MRQRGQLDAALQSYTRALDLNPDFAEAHCNLGATFADLGQLDAAVQCYRRALAINPDFAEAHGNLGSALRGLGQLQEAAASYALALAAKPDFADAYYNLAITLKDLGQLEAAVHNYRCALGLRPQSSEWHSSLGTVLKELGRLEEAVLSYEQALAIKPDFIQALCNLGLAQKDLGQLDKAVLSYQRALGLDSEFSQAHCNLGAVLADLGQQELAVESYQTALRIRPDFAEAHCNIGTAFRELGQLDDAVNSYLHALEIKPDFAEAHCNLGSALKDLGRLDDAECSYRRSLDINFKFSNAHSGLADTLRIRGRHDEAEESYLLALQFNPHCMETRMSQSALYLQRGDFAVGWLKYECRWKKKETRHIVFPGVLWLGETSLVGKTILLYAEQGLGDTLQFVRLVSSLSELGAVVALAGPLSLKRLLLTVQGLDYVVAPGEELPDHDFHCPLLSLPLALGMATEAQIPATLPYLAPLATDVERWALKTAATSPLKRVGIAWAGNPGFKRDKQRSIAFETFTPLFEIAGADFYSLQKGEAGAAELAASAFSSHVTDFTAELHDFADTAALIANLDLVITIDSSVAHLAGAMGKRVWLLNRYDTCWRWMLERDDSPWYPGVMRIFRQPEPGQWAEVIAQVAQALRLELAEV